VDVEHLAALLWAESEADDADDALTMAAHRLRKLFGEESALTIRDGKISLDHDSVWVDAWALERVLSRIEGETERARSLNLDADLHELQRLYRGHFLERDAEEAWILPMQQRLRGRVQRAFVKAGQRLEAEQRWDAGAALYERGIELDPLAEDMYRRLMLCHRARGRLTEASEVYRRCRHMLSVMLGAQPSRETRSVYESLSADY
jgi:DNA-binding SARP family transcriptional activator